MAAGAFGAHALRAALTEDMQKVFEVAVRYQMYHAFALIATAWAADHFSHAALSWGGWCFFSGAVVFSGSLYLLVFTGVTKWGAVTPIGGALLLIGWVLIIVGAWRSPTQRERY